MMTNRRNIQCKAIILEIKKIHNIFQKWYHISGESYHPTAYLLNLIFLCFITFKLATLCGFNDAKLEITSYITINL